MKTNNTFGLFLGLLILFTIGCEQAQGPIKVPPDDYIDSDDIVYTGKVFIGDAKGKFGKDTFKLNAATITDDILTANVSYSGGCKTHQFTLVASEAFLESDPVQLQIYLAHDANGDQCQAYIMTDRQFDLTPIKKRYQESYRRDAGTIVIILKDAPADSELIYEFTM